jgi:toxin YoeB
MRVSWESRAWEDYLYWQNQDKKTLSKINILIKEMQRSPFDGQGKPEPLRGNLTDYWSRRIDKANRIVYKVENDTLVIAACRGHYT